MSVYELEINPGPAEKGAERIVKSFESIKAAMDRMESSVSARANKLVASFSQLSRVRTISREAITQLQSLSSVLGSFRGPSKVAVDNTSRFLNFLNSMGRITLPSGARMAAFLSSLSGFRGPTATAGRNTQSLLRALSGFAMPSGVGGRITAFLTSLGTFRGPSANAGRNTLALLNAVSSFRGTPRNIAAATTAFEALARAISTASTAMGGYRRASGGAIRVPSAAGGRGAFNPKDYARDLGFLNTALFRTQTAFNALGGILAARAIIGASNDIIKMKAQLQAATGSVQQARVQFGFLQDVAMKFGLELTTLGKSYGFFLGSIKGTGVTMEQAKTIFLGFSTAARALQLSTSDVDGVFRALGQMLSKGKLQAEELRGQLGDRLPGAFVRFAVALKMTKTGELDQALKKGAISGEILRKAIISVAESLQIEFAGAADKMSKTADAAFNRLRNTFTLAAAGLGSSGLNEALINISDSIRKLLESDALSAMLSTLGKAFKLLGNNINIVVYIMGTLAVASVLKWMSALSGLNVVMAAARAVMLELAIATAAYQAGMAASAVATTLLTRVTTVLFAVMRAHPFIIIATVIVGVVAALAALRKSNDDALKATSAMTGTMADATNLYDAYILKSYSKADALDRESRALRDNTLAAVDNARAKLGEAKFNISSISQGGEGFGVNSGTYVNGVRATDPQQIGRIVGSVTSGGKYVTATNQKQFRQRVALMQQLETMKRYYPDQYDAYSELHRTVTNDVQSAIMESHQPGGASHLGYDAQTILDRSYGDYNKANLSGASLSGSMPAKTKKKGKGDADAFEQDIRRAMEGIRDLRRATASAYADLQGYLSGQDQIAIGARQEATDRVNQLMDTFKNPATAEKGLITLNARIREQSDILANLSPAAQQAREDLIAFYATEIESQKHAEAAAQAGKAVDDLRKENMLQKTLVSATAQGGRALAEANIQLEIAKQLWDVLPEKAAKIRPKLEEQLRLQEQINRELAYAKELNDAQLQSDNMRDTMSLYRTGNTQETIDYYKNLIEYRNQLKNDGYYNDQINGLVRVRAALLNQTSAYEKIQKQYEESRQLAQDMADAFVNGFQDAIESGQNFGKTIKNIFSDLKNVILQFVLYDPLRKWLTDVFTTGASGRPAPQNGAMVGTRGLSLDTMVSSFASAGGSTASMSSANPLRAAFNTAPIQIQSDGSFSTQRAGASDLNDVTNSLGDMSEIFVTGNRQQQVALDAIPEKLGGNQYFDKLKKVFDYKANGAAITDLFKKGGLSNAGIGKAVGAAGNAIAAYEIGHQVGRVVADTLGLKGKGGNAVAGAFGGAAAGFSLGGPVGAAIGAVVGGVVGFLKKIPKLLGSYGSVVVGQNGVASVGTVGHVGKTTDEAGKAVSQAGADLFNQFAVQYGGSLQPGNYGTFGQHQWTKGGAMESFYSSTGQLGKKYGFPQGVEGVDWVKGTDSQVQAFALLKQIRAGLITGLTDSVRTVAQNTHATTMEGVQGDFQVAQAYDEFIKGSFILPDVARQVRDLNTAFDQLRKQSTALGLSEDKLSAARDRMLKSMKEDFNFGISQGILEITNPQMAAYNKLVKDYKDAVENGMSVGGDLVQVEKYFGLQRAEILKQTFQDSFQQIRDGAKQLLDSLTASQASPLSPTSIFANAQSNFSQLRGELGAGNTANVGNLSDYVQNYLGSAQDLYGSSAQYFDVFREVTQFLQNMQGYTIPGTGAPGDVTGIPDLPTLQSLIDEINAKNDSVVAAINTSGSTSTEIETNQLTELEKISGLLAAIKAGSGSLAGAVGVGGGSTPSTGYYGDGTRFSVDAGSGIYQ